MSVLGDVGAITVGTGPMSTSIPVSAADVAVAVAPSAVSPVTSGEEESTRVVAAKKR